MTVSSRALCVLVCVGAVIVTTFAKPASARAQEPTPEAAAQPAARDPARRLVRYGAISMGLAGASAALAGAMLATQSNDSVGWGIGVTHAALGALYLYDGIARLSYARRTRRRGIEITGSKPWVLYFNTIVSGVALGLSAAPIAVGATQNDPVTLGIGASLAAHMSWFFAFSLTSLIKMKRKQLPWMVLHPAGFRF